jgi:hypothetical protein
MEKDVHPALQESASEVVGSLGGELADLVLPVFGSRLLSALIGEVVPNRMERFARFMTILDRKLRALEDRVPLQQPLSGVKLGLFEDGARLAVRALSDDRLEQLAHLVAEGLTASDIVASDNHRLMGVIEQLSDDEVVYLFSFSQPGQQPAWREQHKALIDPFEELRAYHTARYENPDAPPEAPDVAASRFLEGRRLQIMFDLREQKLTRIGVIRQEQIKPTAEERAAGMVRYYPTQLSALGELVLSRLGLI